MKPTGIKAIDELWAALDYVEGCLNLASMAALKDQRAKVLQELADALDMITEVKNIGEPNEG